MTMLTAMFFISLLFGQLVSLTLYTDASIYIHDVFLLGIIIYSYSMKKIYIPKSGLFIKPLSIFFIIGLISLLVNIFFYDIQIMIISSLYLVRILLYSFLYVIVLNTGVSPEYWLRALFMTGVGFALLGIVQFLFYPFMQNLVYLGWDPHMYRAVSTLLDPNFLGILLTLTILVGVYHMLRYKSAHRYTGFAVGLLFFVLFLTYSRSSFFACIVSLLVWVVISNAKNKKYIVPAVCVLFSGFLLVILFLPDFGGEGSNLFRTKSIYARMSNWKYSIELAKKRPIFGIGFNTLRYEQKEAIKQYSTRGFSHAGAGVDNSVLFIAITTGLAGLASFIYFVTVFARSVRSTLSSVKTKYIGILMLCSSLAIFVHSMFVNSMFYPWVVIWFFVLLGVYEKKIHIQQQ